MCKVKIIKADEKYIESYWKAFDSISREGLYFATTRAYPFIVIREWIKMFIEMKMPSLFLVEEDKVIGFAEADFKCREIGYISMGIIDGYREKGYGTELLKALMKECEDYGYKILEIDVRVDNNRAIGLYKKIGFKEIRVVEKVLRLDKKYYDVLQMEYRFNKNK